MSEQKFTPGPWQAERNAAWGPTVRAPQVEVRTASGRTEADFVAFKLNSMADARLIAAAPDMLSALERINEFACYTQENQDARDDMLLNIGNAARAAIAKATEAS